MLKMAWGTAEIVGVDGDTGARPLLTLMASRVIDVSRLLCGLDGAGKRGRWRDWRLELFAMV